MSVLRSRRKVNKIPFIHQLSFAKLPIPSAEFRFHPDRKWKFDYAWEGIKVAVEIEGLTRPWEKSRHTTNTGYEKDCEKYNAGVLLGWRILRFTYDQVYSGYALKTIEEFFK
jgi:very-short-patch-repair endonuclease